ncbi:MAG: radical SAM protein [Candidatus Omnitrophica bacterium]|nr:radical SAM protein [Candidatus Omnitrophota bacterium]
MPKEKLANHKKAERPSSYQYPKIICDHLGNDVSRVFNGELIYPRQMEIHLPADRKTPCNFNCYYCQGKALDRGLGHWEEQGLVILEKLKGAIPFYIYGGAYTEPLMNEYLLDYLKLTKKYHNYFGIHTNGSLFIELEEQRKFCSSVIRLADSPQDYISTSLDAGTVKSHCKTKNVKEDFFSRIIEGIRMLVKLRGNKAYPSIRVCYLMNAYNSSPEEIKGIVQIMKDIKVDSLRFSVPYDLYGKDFKDVRKYRENVEIPFGKKCEKIVQPHLSLSTSEKPYIFWHPPGFQDVEKMRFKQCIYSYYQMTFGADGHVYRCSSTASPSFKDMILGKVTDDFKEFNRMVLANHDPDWDAHTCFKAGARCNRIALEINEAWDKGSLFHL